jgi:type I restriction enzyme S subunit
MQKTLPKGWKWVRLGEVAGYINGKAFKPSDWSNAGVPIIRIQNLTDNSKPFNYYQGECESKYHIKKGDILISWSASLGIFVWGQELAYLNQHIFKANPYTEIIDKSYFVYAVSTVIEGMKRKVHGATMTHIVKNEFNKILLPLPPLPIQHKIVEILEEADNLRRLRRQADEKMKDLIPSLFVQMFGDPVRNPKGWEARKLGDITDRITSQILPTDLPDTAFFYIGLEHIESNTGTLINANHQKGEDIKSTKNKFEAGDILYGKLRPYLNKVLLVDRSGICSTDIWVLRPVKALTNGHFVSTFLMFQQIVNILNLKTEGANLPRVKATSFDRLLVPLPPLPLQQEFAKMVEDIEAEKARQTESRKKLDELFNSLMQRAFTGELVS